MVDAENQMKEELSKKFIVDIAHKMDRMFEVTDRAPKVMDKTFKSTDSTLLK